MSTSYTFDYLPIEVLQLRGYDFFQFIKSTLGEPEAHLLNKVAVKSISALLITEDPLDIFNYDVEDDELENLKSQLCFKLKNQKLLIKPGVISGFRSLKDALKKRVNEALTRTKKKSFNFNPSSISSLPTTIATRPLPNRLSLSEHKEYVLKFINKWCLENKENFELENFDLEENVDFIVNIELDENSDVRASIKCKCNKLILLGKNDNKIQVSNYYKHLQSIACDHMQQIKNAARNLKSIQQQQSSIAGILTAAAQSQTSLIQFSAVSPIATQETFDSNTSTLSNQVTSNGKRRLTSQSKQHGPSKRSRI
ncbi:unnamed protein product [Rotaria magnacalcarata]|uniref:Uncharacterized protein n=1 Tax=Rotaria magnacalcarata TaxID=392030 RepID=A0A816Z272_9BILA|nr:unnamed protein product [Rotaria magnacalcarata]CAF2186350.1 unnamed protein product [Rotaria magnacalcarata]CAF3953279.1 unnamed protein product [Rotaria magnacalcarata]CAF4143015.1 unnamed protein product [Rotaria magnacalcarata]